MIGCLGCRRKFLYFLNNGVFVDLFGARDRVARADGLTVNHSVSVSGVSVAAGER